MRIMMRTSTHDLLPTLCATMKHHRGLTATSGRTVEPYTAVHSDTGLRGLIHEDVKRASYRKRGRTVCRLPSLFNLNIERYKTDMQRPKILLIKHKNRFLPQTSSPSTHLSCLHFTTGFRFPTPTCSASTSPKTAG